MAMTSMAAASDGGDEDGRDDGGNEDGRDDGGDDDDRDDDDRDSGDGDDGTVPTPRSAPPRPGWCWYSAGTPSPPNRVGGSHQGPIVTFDIPRQVDRAETERFERRIDT